METLTIFAFILIPMLLALVIITVWSPRRFWVKIGAVLLGLGSVIVLYIGFADLLSRPKPVSLEWMQRSAKQAVVLGAKAVEDEAIYLWLQLPAVRDPRYYKLPWDRKLAEELQKAMREARQKGGSVVVKLPFEPSLDRKEKMFHPLPQPAAPPKDIEPNNPELFQRPRREH